MKRTAPVKKNDEISIKIDAYTSEGYGIGRVDGFAVFVPYAVKGETVNVHIVKAEKNYAIGKLLEITEENTDDRAEVLCTAYKRCGGCTLQHMKYEKQLEFKRERVLGALMHLGRIENADKIVFNTLSAPSPLRYRNKASFPFGTVNGKVTLGFFSPASHNLVPVDDCPIQDTRIVSAMRITRDWANKYGISAFDEKTCSGILRHLVLRTTEKSMLVTVVTSGKALPFADRLWDALSAQIPDVAGLVQNINDRNTNVILGSSYKTLYGTDTLYDEICGLKFSVRTPSFLQVNHEQTQRLYEKVLEFLDLHGTETVFDVYCGIGTISLLLASHAKSVIGIESVREAVEDARKNAEINGITNTVFVTGEAERVLPELVAKGSFADAIVIDPPRKGCEIQVLQAIAQSGAKKLVYVSCNPETLARDMRILADLGFCAKAVQPVDMFPQTAHVETVVCLSREKADDCRKEQMISDERIKYKSWSNLKKQMNDLLCDSLKDKISYFYTNYHEVHNAYGRATINYNKKELVAFSWVEMYAQEYEVSQLYQEGKKVSYGELEKGKWMPECKLCDADFIHYLTIYLKTDIATSLHSENYLLCVFAYMDRRVGKRTLIKIKDEVEKLPEWVKQFYQIRCEADGIVFPPKRITDETVVLLGREKV